MGADIYRKLQQHLDNFPVPYPASPSGVEVSILKRLFNPQEAEIALALNLLPERAEKIHSRLPALQMPLEELRSLLEAMTMKGLVNGGIKKSKGKNVPTYGKAPLVVGMFEWQVNRLTRDLVEDFHTYVDESFGDALFTKKTSQMRTVPINTRIASRGQIGRYDDIRNFINNSRGPFAVMNCICRQARELTGHYCSSSESHETCLTIGEGAVWMRRLRRARLITRADCLEVLDRAEAQGLVLQPQNSQSPQFICCCCPDCCEILIRMRASCRGRRLR